MLDIHASDPPAKPTLPPGVPTRPYWTPPTGPDHPDREIPIAPPDEEDDSFPPYDPSEEGPFPAHEPILPMSGTHKPHEPPPLPDDAKKPGSLPTDPQEDQWTDGPAEEGSETVILPEEVPHITPTGPSGRVGTPDQRPEQVKRHRPWGNGKAEGPEGR